MQNEWGGPCCVSQMEDMQIISNCVCFHCNECCFRQQILVIMPLCESDDVTMSLGRYLSEVISTSLEETRPAPPVFSSRLPTDLYKWVSFYSFLFLDFVLYSLGAVIKI